MVNKELLNPEPRRDIVNHPLHYTTGKYEVIDILEDKFKNDPLLWQVGKYIMRHKHKNNPLQDLKKAQFYLNRKIKNMEEENGINNSENKESTGVLKALPYLDC